MNDHNTYPTAPVLAEADNLATIATRLLEAPDELEKAQLAADKDGSTTNMDMLEHAKALQRDRAADMRFNIDEYSKRIDRYRDADGRDTRLIAAANAALHYIAAIHGAEVPMAPFDADLTASALAGALNPYKTPHGREVDNKMAAAVSTAKQARRIERECGCGWHGHLEDCLQLGAVGPLCPACRETTEEAEQGQTVPANQQRAGVYHKFNVSRTDGRDLPGGDRYGAEYFVLDVTHDKFAKPALAAYAAACRNDYPALSDDMVRRYGIAQQQAVPDAIALLQEFSDYVRAEQMSTDGRVEYSAARINHFALKAREMLAAAPQAAVAVPDATGGKLRLLVAACNRIEEEAEEFEGPDGLETGITVDHWHEFAEALTAARKALAASQHAAAPLSRALADIAAERRRQMEVEGWTPEHDDAYQEGHLADAAQKGGA